MHANNVCLYIMILLPNDSVHHTTHAGETGQIGVRTRGYQKEGRERRRRE